MVFFFVIFVNLISFVCVCDSLCACVSLFLLAFLFFIFSLSSFFFCNCCLGKGSHCRSFVRLPLPPKSSSQREVHLRLNNKSSKKNYRPVVVVSIRETLLPLLPLLRLPQRKNKSFFFQQGRVKGGRVGDVCCGVFFPLFLLVLRVTSVAVCIPSTTIVPIAQRANEGMPRAAQWSSFIFFFWWGVLMVFKFLFVFWLLGSGTMIPSTCPFGVIGEKELQQELRIFLLKSAKMDVRGRKETKKKERQGNPFR